MGLIEELTEFRYLPDEVGQMFEEEYDRVLDIDLDNWQEAKEAAEKVVLDSKYGDIYSDAMLLYLGKKAKEQEAIKSHRGYLGI